VAPSGRLGELHQIRARWLPLTLKVAAVLLVGLGVTLVLLRGPAGDGEGDGERPAATQESDGSWAPGKWDGQPKYTVALTGLAMLSFVADPRPPAGPYAEAVARAAGYLVASQAPDGRLGPRFSGELYNHGIATVALLEHYALTRDESLKGPIARAVGHIRSNQTASGGWGYAGGRRVNTSVTAWQLNAPLLASSLGWPDSRPAAEKGLAWLATMIDAEGRAGYERPGHFPDGSESLTAMAAFLFGAAPGRPGEGEARGSKVARSLARAVAEERRDVDYYRSFFFAYALHAVEGTGGGGRADTTGGPAPEPSALVESQVTEGPYSGSFEPRDRWSVTGGRVYSTAMAALSLQADEHAPKMLAMMRGTLR